jgi:hypothetical protein
MSSIFNPSPVYEAEYWYYQLHCVTYVVGITKQQGEVIVTITKFGPT